MPFGTWKRENRISYIPDAKYSRLLVSYHRLSNGEILGKAELAQEFGVTRRVQPVGIMFSEYYFYLTAFIEDIDRESHFEHADDLFPTIYRIDRIRAFQVTEDHFRIPYRDRFEEGEFRKRVQFMYGGTLRTVRFTYSGLSIEAVLDRLPTAEILKEEDGVYTVQVEVFGKGIDMWLRSQGKYVTLVG